MPRWSATPSSTRAKSSGWPSVWSTRPRRDLELREEVLRLEDAREVQAVQVFERAPGPDGFCQRKEGDGPGPGAEADGGDDRLQGDDREEVRGEGNESHPFGAGIPALGHRFLGQVDGALEGIDEGAEEGGTRAGMVEPSLLAARLQALDRGRDGVGFQRALAVLGGVGHARTKEVLLL